MRYSIALSVWACVVCLILAYINREAGYQQGFRDGAKHGWDNAEHFYGIGEVKTQSRTN